MLDTEKHNFADIYSESPVTYIYDESKKADVDKLVLDGDYEIARNESEVKTKFGINWPSKIVIKEFKEGSGTINPKELIRKLKRAIHLMGGEIRHSTKVRTFSRENSKILLQTNAEELICDKVVFASGPYTKGLLGGLMPKLELKRMYLSFFQPDRLFWDNLTIEEKERFISFFPTAHFNEEIYYNMIEKWEDGYPIIKVGGHMRRFEIIDNNDIWKEEVPKSEIYWAKRNTLECLNAFGFNAKEEDLMYKNGYCCVYTLTESETPIVSYLMDEKGEPMNNIVVMAGLSGIGAKGTLAYGKIAADYFHPGLVKDTLGVKTKNEMSLMLLS